MAVWTQHLWNLSIAIITYMILVHPLSTFVSSVERHLIWLWPIFWAIAFLVNGIAWIFVGFGDIGGYCSFKSKGNGTNFIAIFQFVPRAFVVLVVLVLYTHLFFFLRRVNLFNRANSSRSHPRSANADSDPDRSHHHQQQQRSGQRDPLEENNRRAVVTERQSDEASGAQGMRSELWRMWKRTLSQSTGNDANTTRGGSASTQGKSSVGGIKPGDMPVIEMVDYSGVSPKTAPAETLSPPPPPLAATNLTPAVPIIRPPRQRPSTANLAGSQRSTTLPARPSTGNRLPSYLLQQSGDSNSERNDSLYGLDDDSSPFQPMVPRRDVRDFEMTSPPQEHLKHYSLSPLGVDQLRRNQEEKGVDADVESTEGKWSTDASALAPQTLEEPSYESMLGQNWTWGMAVGGQQQQPSCSASTPKSPGRRRFGTFFSPSSSKRDRQGVGSGSSSTEENGVESLGSTLNRQASILLLLYPFVYCCLFSVSIIRIIVDLTGPPKTAMDQVATSENALHSIARWAVFAQGAIDAIIFQLVERSFRSRLKRRRRLAAGEAVADPWWRRAVAKLGR